MDRSIISSFSKLRKRVPLKRQILFLLASKRRIYEWFLIKSTQKQQKRAVKKVKNKKKIKVAFFVIHASIWKYDLLYKLLEADERFEPVIVICPYTLYGENTMIDEMKAAYGLFSEKKYNVLSTFDESAQEWLDVKQFVNPDVVFFTNPHNLTKAEYYIEYWTDTLTCYVPYAFVIIHMLDSHYNQFFHHLLWKHFCETEVHKSFALEFNKRTQSNVHVTGYPALDSMLLKDYKPENVWKIKGNYHKRIIWAPHHTFDDNKEELSYSNFLEYAEFMLEFAATNNEDFQFAYKPHPILKPKLYVHPSWGKEKTDTYYKAWQDLANAQLEEGEYLDLFATSDAMIMDSASFMVEYLYTKKPIMFMMRDGNITDRFNNFGKMVFEKLYKSRSRADVLGFFEMVRKREDSMAAERNYFFEQLVLPSGGNTASENIYNEIIKELC